MTAYRYWGIRGNPASGEAYFSAATIAMATSAGGANLCNTPANAYASDNAGGSYVAGNAADGDPTTSWADTNGDTSATWWYDFGTPVDIQEVQIQAGQGGLAPYSPPAFFLISSDNVSYWNYVVSFTCAAWTEGQIQVFDVASGTPLPALPPYRWNSRDSGPGLSVNDNASSLPSLTVTASSPSTNWDTIRAFPFYKTGKYYIEFSVTAASTMMVGIADAAVPLANYLGSPAGSIGYQSDGELHNQASNSKPFAAYASGDVIGMTLDVTNAMLCFRKNTDPWNNTAGDDPATGAGGISFSSIAAPVAPAFCSNASGAVCTINFGGQPFVNAPPAGFVGPAQIVQALMQPQVFFLI